MWPAKIVSLLMLAAASGSAAEQREPAVATPVAGGLAPGKLQLDLGLGLGLLALHSDAGSLILSGTSMPLGVSAGVSLTNALVLFGELSDIHMLVFDSEVSYGAGEFDLYGAGVGLKYYLTPGFFLSGSGSMARLQIQRSGNDLELSRWGAMARLSAGLEWPVSPRWSVGIAGEVHLGTVQSRGLDWGNANDPVYGQYAPKGLALLVLASFHQPAEQPSGCANGGGTPSASPCAPTPAPPASSAGVLAPLRLYLDARLGVGALWARPGDGPLIDGMTIPLALAAGASLTKSLVVFGEVDEIHMLGPARRGPDEIFSLDLYGAGLGLRYYLTPSGFFASGAVSLARMQFKGTDTDSHQSVSETSHWGPMGRVSAGREWRMSPRWSGGVAGEFQFGRLSPTSSEYYNYRGDTYAVETLSLLALATFNPAGVGGAASASATGVPAATPPAGYHAHDRLYLNADVGMGWAWLTNRLRDQVYSSPDYSLSGRGTRLVLSAGYAWADRFVVFGAYSQLQVHDPAGDQDVIATLEWYGFGPGLRYYLMPANVFLSGALLMSRVAPLNSTPGDSIYGVDRTSRWGATGQVSVGKEWWVLGDLGVGLAAEFAYGKMPGTDNWLTYTVKGLSLLASFSFN